MRNLLLLFVLTLSISTISAQCENVNPDCTILNDFECQTNYIGLAAVTNPAPDAVNGSSLVGEYTDLNDPYDAMIVNFGGPIDLSVNNILKLKIYTTVAPAGRLLAILEGGASPRIELAINAIVNGAWTEYTFDFSSQATADHQTLVLIYNADITRTNGPELYFLDDVRWDANGSVPDPCAGVSADPMILNDFECQQNEPFQGCFPIVNNPLVDANNSSSRVGCFTDIGGGFDNIFIQFDAPLDLSTNNQLRLKVNTQVAGSLLVKLEGGSSPSVETAVFLAGDGSWEEPLFDFSTETGTDHTRLVVFFNAGVTPGGSDKYFIDDLLWEAALPVELAAFTAEPVKEDVALSWTTLTESGAADYTVEHTTRSTNWAVAGVLPAVGESRTEQTYGIVHEQPGSGEHLYRLVMRDLDGTTEYSEVVAVTLANTGQGVVSAYPNPFEGELSVSFEAETAGTAELKLKDLLGRTVSSKKAQVAAGQVVLQIQQPADMKPGRYLVQVICGGKKMTTSVIRH